MRKRYDVIVVGAGPAGMASAVEMANRGLEVALFDEQAKVGGQIYRNIEGTSGKQRDILGEDYVEGLELAQSFKKATEEGRLSYFPRTRVWEASENGEVSCSRDGKSGRVKADFLVLSTGAMERPVPFPGWTLPGVMTCGGASNLFKDSALAPTGPTAIVGSGPLVWLVAEHMLHLDVPLVGIFDTTPQSQMFTAMKHMPQALKRFGYMMKGVKMILGVEVMARKKGVPVYKGVSGLQAFAENDKLSRISVKKGSRELKFDVSTLLVSEGIIPNVNLFRQVGCKHVWDSVQRFWYPQVDDEGRTSLPKVFVAGDGAFVHGAHSAAQKGQITGLAIAREMRRISPDMFRKEVVSVREALALELAPRPFIDAMYAPRKDLFTVADDQKICRCEGVTAGRVRELVREGLYDHNEIKAIIRCGMGPCQGRMCTSAVNEIIAQEQGCGADELRPHRLRPPIKPVTLEELANATLTLEEK